MRSFCKKTKVVALGFVVFGLFVFVFLFLQL